MLLWLRIKDFAIIEDVSVEFGAGLNVLTGETGAGKSILIDALSLSLGGRASSEMIRSGAVQAEVEALFSIDKLPRAIEYLKQNELYSGDELVIKRLLPASSRSRARVNGRLVTTAQLYELGRLLVDIYGQHEHQSLLDPERHLALLDEFGGLNDEAGKYREAFNNYSVLHTEMERLSLDETKLREREDFLKFRIQEIERAGLIPGEDDELLKEKEILKNAGALGEICRDGCATLYDDEGSVFERLRDVTGSLERAATLDGWFGSLVEQLESAGAQVEDVAAQLSAYQKKLDADPQRLTEVDDRLAEIKALKRKYGQGINEILELLSQSRTEARELGRREERLEEIGLELEKAKLAAQKLARDLSRKRGEIGERLSQTVVKELGELNMARTRFKVMLEAPGSAGPELGPKGFDSPEFFLSPNPGEELKPLAKIASGGELSRIMLALKSLLKEPGGVGTLALDEVDAGIGGPTAEAVGRRMQQLSGTHQVLCVTHLPQIACFADCHYRVLKTQTANSTQVSIERLDHRSRIEEVARMLGGATITATSRAHAEEMIKIAAGRLTGRSQGKKAS